MWVIRNTHTGAELKIVSDRYAEDKRHAEQVLKEMRRRIVQMDIQHEVWPTLDWERDFIPPRGWKRPKHLR